MATDRTQFKEVLVGSLGSLRTVVNALLCIAQDAQRFHGVDTGAAASAATGTFNMAAGRIDRPMVCKEVRILPGGALTFNASNYITINYGWTNDNGGSLVVQGGITTSNTAANGATGNWAAGTSILVPALTPNANANVGPQFPANTFLQVSWTNTGAGGVAVPAGTRFQFLMEEV